MIRLPLTAIALALAGTVSQAAEPSAAASAATKTGEAIKKGATKVGDAVGTTVERTEAGVEKGAKKVGEAASTTAERTKEGVKKGAKKIKRGAKKAKAAMTPASAAK